MASPESVQFRAILQQIKEQPPASSIQEQRARMEGMLQLPVPEGTQVEKVSVDGIPAEWVAAPGVADEGVLLYLHGGAYAVGSCNTHRELGARLSAASGVRALLIEYRLAPENPFPAAVEDAVKAYRWLLGQGIKPEQIAIAGDSAGGGLTLATLFSLRDAGDPLPAVAALLSPWTDLEGTGDSVKTRAESDPLLSGEHLIPAGQVYLNGADPRNPLASPLYGDFKGLPPMLIQVGGDEILLDDAARVAEKARSAGVDVRLDIWPEMWHVWQASGPALPEAQQATEQLGQFMGERIRSSSAVTSA
jgi:acetyl esterase/lipase